MYAYSPKGEQHLLIGFNPACMAYAVSMLGNFVGWNMTIACYLVASFVVCNEY